jgi:hypothetical protein
MRKIQQTFDVITTRRINVNFNQLARFFQRCIRSSSLTRGDALRFASRLPPAFIFRAFGALFRLFVQSNEGRDCVIPEALHWFQLRGSAGGLLELLCFFVAKLH